MKKAKKHQAPEDSRVKAGHIEKCAKCGKKFYEDGITYTDGKAFCLDCDIENIKTEREKEAGKIIEDLESLRNKLKEGLLNEEEYVDKVRNKATELIYFDMAKEEAFNRKEDEKIMAK